MDVELSGTMELGEVTVRWAQIGDDLWVAPLGSLPADVDLSHWMRWVNYPLYVK